MSRNLYLLLPDGREPSGSVLSVLGRPGITAVTARSNGVWSMESDGDSVAILTLLSGIEWAYPILVAFREEGDHRWSHATVLGRNEAVQE